MVSYRTLDLEVYGFVELGWAKFQQRTYLKALFEHRQTTSEVQP